MTKSDNSHFRFDEEYCEEHAVEILRLLNRDRKTGQQFCDGILTARGREYAVHICIVGAVTNVFDASPVAEVSEYCKDVASVGNVAHKTLEDVLDFIYTGNVDINDDNVYELLEGADCAHITNLKFKCEDYLLDGVKRENCLKSRACAQLYDLDNLYYTAVDVVADNLADVTVSDDFKALHFPDVASILTIRKTETFLEAAFLGIIGWVMHSANERLHLFPKLFVQADFTLVSESFLNEVIMKERLVYESLACLQFLMKSPCGLRLTRWPPEPTRFLFVGGTESHLNFAEYSATHYQKPQGMIVKRHGATAAKIGTNMYVAGGGDEMCTIRVVFKSVEVLDLKLRRPWKSVADMFESRQHAASAVMFGDMFVSGGYNSQFYLSSCERYDCNRNQWYETNSMLYKRAHHSMVAIEDNLLCLGGWDGVEDQNFVERYDFSTNCWIEVAPLLEPKSEMAAIVLNEQVYAIGGRGETSLDSVDRYDPKTDIWIKLQPLNVARRQAKACALEGKIYVVGGIDACDMPLTSVEVYDEASDNWAIYSESEVPHHNFAVVAI